MTDSARRPATFLLVVLSAILLASTARFIAPSGVAGVTTLDPTTTGGGDGAAVSTGTASAATASMGLAVLTWMNRDRSALGLRPLRRDRTLGSLATDRAARLAGLGILTHELAGIDIGASLDARGVRWFRFAEDIGMTSAPWGTSAANSLYQLWKASPAHWAEITSGQLNYFGIAFAYRPENGATYASIVFTESPDHTAPVALMMSAQAVPSSGATAAVYTWRGSDPLLQTHTAGLLDFDLQYRLDGGEWRTLRDTTTTTSLTLKRRPPGHSYWVRVRGRDRRGNVSGWSRAMRVVVR